MPKHSGEREKRVNVLFLNNTNLEFVWKRVGFQTFQGRELIWVVFRGSFESEALENEDRGTKHPNLETTVGWRTTTLSLAWRKPNQVEAMDA